MTTGTAPVSHWFTALAGEKGLWILFGIGEDASFVTLGSQRDGTYSLSRDLSSCRQRLLPGTKQSVLGCCTSCWPWLKDDIPGQKNEISSLDTDDARWNKRKERV